MEQFMVANWGDHVGHLHWGWDSWWKAGGWRIADPPNSPQHLIWKDAVLALPRLPDTVFAVVRHPVTRMLSEHVWQRNKRRGTRLGKLVARLPFPIWLRLMLALLRIHPHAFDNHLRPQVDFVPVGARVFRLEDGLGPVLDWLATETGLNQPVSVPHAIPGGSRARVRPVDAARIAGAHGDDFARFGYDIVRVELPGRDLGDWIAEFFALVLAFLDRRGAL